VVIGEGMAETLPVFVEKAEKENAPIYFAENKYVAKKLETLPKGKMRVAVADLKGDDFELTSGLSGIYQLKNIATVLAAVDILNENQFFNIPRQSVENGIANVLELTNLRGRWEILRENPRVVADIGHNEGGMRENMVQLQLEQFENLHFVFGMVKDKDIAAVLSLLPKTATYYFTQASTERAMKAVDLQQLAEKFGLRGKSYETVQTAVQEAMNAATARDFVYIGGSNYVVAEWHADDADFFYHACPVPLSRNRLRAGKTLRTQKLH
jgi:dihydrofolate synthase/folylpolyglutamate synthase